LEQFQEFRDKAKQNIKIADHMLGVTYPLVKDPKLLLAIMENIFLAYSNSVSAILYHQRLFKKIPPFQDSFESKFNMFKERIVLKHNIDKGHIQDIQDIKEVITEHKKSPIEFARKDRFVICSDHYRMRTIGTNEIQNYINKAKLFIQLMDNIVRENERIFG
jgi:hypothetical protein